MRLLAGSFAVLVSAALAAQAASEPALRVRGRVLDSNGQPLAKAGASLDVADTLTTAAVLTAPQARCAADGSFELVAPRWRDARHTPYALSIVAPGKVGLRVPNVELLVRQELPATGAPLDLGEIRLPDGFTLTGRVRGADGKPLAGAHVVATDCLSPYPWFAPSHGAEAVTGKNGVFVLAGVFPHAMALRVYAEGHYDLARAWVDLAQPLDVQLEPSGFVDGTLQDEAGAPVDGAVWVSYESMGARAGSVPVVGGKFRLTVTQPYRFLLQAADATMARSVQSELLVGPTKDVALRFGAGPNERFLVHAVDAATGATVAPIRAAGWWGDDDLIERMGGELEDMLHWSERASGADGRVWLDSTPFGSGKGIVRVRAHGYALFEATKVVWQNDGELVAKLEREARIEGRVVDAAGAPVAGAWLRCERVREKPAGAPNAWPLTTAADGSFTIAGLDTKSYRVTAWHANGTQTATATVVCKARGEAAPLELALPTGVAVTGTLRGARSDWRVVLDSVEAESARGRWSLGTGALDAADRRGSVPLAADGTFRFVHRGKGMHRLALVVPAPPRQGGALVVPLEDVRTAAEDEVVDVDVTKRLPGAIAGKAATSGADVPVGRLAVVAVRQEKDTEPWLDHQEQLRRRRWALLAPDGTFRIAVAAGTYRVEVVDVATGVVVQHGEDDVVVAASATVRRELAIPLVEVRVRCTAEGRPRLHADRVEVLAEGADRFSTLTLFGGGAAGTPGADLAGPNAEAVFFVAPGRVRVRVGVGAVPGPHGFSWGQEPSVEETVEAELGPPCTTTLALPPPAEPVGK